MRALTPLPLTLAGLSTLAIVSLGTADITLSLNGTPIPTAIRQWTLWTCLGLALVATVIIAARWAVASIERMVAHMTPQQIDEVCAAPAFSDTIFSIVGPQIAAWRNIDDDGDGRHLRAVGDDE